MRNTFNYCLSGLLLMMLFWGASVPDDAIVVTSLGNCGFMYQTQTSKILIDPFGTAYGDYFHLLSKETQARVVEGVMPFDEVDLLLITHIHGDHFDPFLGESFLVNHPNTKMICPPQVYLQMKDSCQHFAQIEPQIISPQMQLGDCKLMEFNGISLKVMRLQHGTNRSLEGVDVADYTDYERTENFGYEIQMGKKTIFHQGDACLKINQEALNHLSDSIHIAHLGYFDWDTTSFSLLKNKLHVKNVIYMHGTIPAQELSNEFFQQLAPQLTFCSNEMERITF